MWSSSSSLLRLLLLVLRQGSRFLFFCGCSFCCLDDLSHAFTTPIFLFFLFLTFSLSFFPGLTLHQSTGISSSLHPPMLRAIPLLRLIFDSPLALLPFIVLSHNSFPLRPSNLLFFVSLHIFNDTTRFNAHNIPFCFTFFAPRFLRGIVFVFCMAT